MTPEVLPARPARTLWLLVRPVLIGAALAVSVGKCAERVSLIRQAEIQRMQDLPWPCDYDRGVLEACRGKRAR